VSGINPDTDPSYKELQIRWKKGLFDRTP